METLAFVVNIFTCIGVIIAVLEFGYTYKATLAENERKQKQDTLDFYLRIKDNLYRINHIIYERYKRDKIVYSEIESDNSFIEEIKSYLNMMEIVATGINTGIYNVYVFDRLYGDVCVRVAKQLEDYIANRRNLIGEQEIYRDYELLIKKLEEIQQKRDSILNTDAEIKHKML